MKFSIRDLLLVTVIVALAVGWWVDRVRLGRLLKKESEWKEALKVQPIPMQYLQMSDPRRLRD